MSSNIEEYTVTQLAEACAVWEEELSTAQDMLKQKTKSKAARSQTSEYEINELRSQITTLEKQLEWATSRLAAIIKEEKRRKRNYDLALAVLGISLPALLCFYAFPFLGLLTPTASLGWQPTLCVGFAAVPYGLSIIVSKYERELSFWLPGNSFPLAYLVILIALPFGILGLFSFHGTPSALELTKVLLATIMTLVTYFAIAFGLKKVCFK